MSGLALALSLLLAAAGCGSGSGGSLTETTVATRATGSVTVFAAASLTEAFGDAQVALKATAPDLSVTYSFAGSGALVAQIRQGAPADVIATADTASMARLTDAGLVDAPVTFARNRLEILVAPGNPRGIASLADLARGDVKVVLEDETVPAGRYAAQALAAAGVTVDPVSQEVDVKAAVAKVTLGEADATVVYATDVAAAGAKAEGVVIPDAQNVVAEYPVAVVKATANRGGATTFVDAIVRGTGQDALRRRGFLPAA
ncbi:MAG: molybdate transport system substrate-binding protein [Actinomycetota bacterium]|nr:molybdate transport system substrate-binding protein [Actinomycetota bacterium]